MNEATTTLTRAGAAMGEGLSLESAAASCGIGPRTALTWQTQHDDFRQAVEEGRHLKASQ